MSNFGSYVKALRTASTHLTEEPFLFYFPVIFIIYRKLFINQILVCLRWMTEMTGKFVLVESLINYDLFGHKVAHLLGVPPSSIKYDLLDKTFDERRFCKHQC